MTDTTLSSYHRMGVAKKNVKVSLCTTYSNYEMFGLDGLCFKAVAF